MNTPLPPGSICLFAAYTPNGNLPDYTKFYLKNLMLCGLDLHIILSGTTVITQETLNFCKQHGFNISCRPNGGLDFGAWQYLIAQGVTKNAPYILLANDSVFGPFSPLPPLLARLQAAQRPAWGLVASRAITPHIQSWFIGFSQATWQSPALQRVFTLPFENMSRSEIIWHGELGLSIALRETGVPLHALWSDLTSTLSKFVPVNPTHAYWRKGVRSGLVPFLKQELLRDNPCQTLKKAEWRTLIPAQSGFNPQWITDYLKNTPPRNSTSALNRRGIMLYSTLSQLDKHLPFLSPGTLLE